MHIEVYTFIRQVKIVLAFCLTLPLGLVAQSTTHTSISCGTANISFQQQCYDTTYTVSFVHVHENETTALQAAKWLLDSVKNYCLVTWQCQEQRYVDFNFNDHAFRFDPNRIYTRKGLRATLGINNQLQNDVLQHVETVARLFVQQYINGKKIVVAVHNNTDAGALSVKSYAAKGVYEKDAKQVFINSKKDADDFFYTSELTFFNFMKNKGFNVVLQDNKKVTDDGSLSVYCSQQNIPYVNVEAQFEHLAYQQEMLNAVWEFIASTPTLQPPVHQ